MNGAERTPRLRLHRAMRLRTARHFQRVYQRGSRATGEWLTVVALRSRGQDGLRLGVSVSKAHGGAVRRNKIKRLLREAFRLEQHALPRGFDVVLIPRQVAGRFPLAALRHELLRLCARIAEGRGKANTPRPS